MNAHSTQICIPPGERARTLLVSTLFAMAVSVGWSTQASALPMNGSFEYGFNDWYTIGNTSVVGTLGDPQNAPPDPIVPVHGYSQALISNAPGDFGTTDDPVTTENLAEFLGGNDPLMVDAIEEFLDDAYSVEGSAIKTATTFHIAPGQGLSFFYNFLTTNPYEYPYNEYNDFAFVVLNAVSTQITNVVLALPTLSLSPVVLGFEGYDIYQTGYRQFSIGNLAPGDYTLGIGIAHVNTDFFSSALLVDNVSVPEPSSVMLLLLGLAGLVWWRRSKVA